MQHLQPREIVINNHSNTFDKYKPRKAELKMV